MAAHEPVQSDGPRADGTALARGWLENSPFVAQLGIAVDRLDPGHAVLSMPFAESLPTMGDVVHGGALALVTYQL